jgi:hypothetical protein
MKIQNVSDVAFRPYGRILTKDYDVAELLKHMESEPAPENVIYVPSVEKMENTNAAKELRDSLYGGMPIQIGYCNGTNRLLNAVEYHRDSEINIACTDLILILGKEQDIEADMTYDSSKMEAFYVKAGEVVELYATTLHYAPCSYDGKPFKDIVVLPKGTNTQLKSVPAKAKEDRLLAAVNKWLIAHPDAKIDGAFIGIKGENLSV